MNPDGGQSRILILLCTAACMMPLLQAHQPGESYLFLEAREDGMTGRTEFPLAMMERLFGGAPTQQQMHDYTRKVLSFTDDSGVIGYELEEARVLTVEELDYSQVMFRLTRSSPPLEMSIRFEPFDDPIASRQALLVLSKNAYDPSSVAKASAENVIVAFTPSEPEQQVRIPTKPSGRQALIFLKRGLKRCWSSPSHALFLLALLILSVLRPSDKTGWEPEPSLRTAATTFCRLFMVYLLAASAALAVSQFNALHLGSQLTSSLLALSLGAAGLLLLLPGLRRVVLVVVAIGGAIHGYYLGGTLEHLVTGLRTAGIVLGSFSLGLWVGLLGASALALPLLFRIRIHSPYRKVLMPGTGLLLAACGFWTSIDRII